MAKNNPYQWSATASSNTDIGGISLDGDVATPAEVDDALRELMSQWASKLASDTIASDATTDLSAVEAECITVTGTTTITAFGTLKAGALKYLTFAAALTLTHNGTSLIVPGGADVTTSAGATALVQSLGSGNWRVLFYQDGIASGAVLSTLYDANTILAANSDDTPAALTVAEQTIVGRITGGNIAALTATQIRTLINVEDGADVTDETNVVSALDGATLSSATVAGTDGVLVQDADDSNSLKKVTAQSIADLATAGAQIATGTYTGDGGTSKSITGVGFQPKFVMIARASGGTQFAQDNDISIVFTSLLSAAGVAIGWDSGGSDFADRSDAITALGSDGFTVDDAGSDQHPNKSGVTYAYVAIG